MPSPARWARIAAGISLAAGFAWILGGVGAVAAQSPVLVLTDGVNSDTELVGVDSGGALLSLGSLEQGDGTRPLRVLWPYQEEFVGDNTDNDVIAADGGAIVVDDFINSDAGDEQTALGAERNAVVSLSRPRVRTSIENCSNVQINLGDPLPVPPVAFEGPLVALSGDCPFDGSPSSESDYAAIVNTATSPTHIARVMAPGSVDGVALGGTLVAVRSGSTVVVANSDTGAAVRTLTLPGAKQPQMFTQPLALASDGTVYAVAFSGASDSSCGPIGALLAYEPGSTRPVTLASAACGWPITITSDGLLYVRPDTPDLSQLVSIPSRGGMPQVVVTFREPPPTGEAVEDLMVGDMFTGGLGSNVNITAYWPFEYAAEGDVVAYRAPGCAVDDQVWFASLGEPAPAAPQPCALQVSHFQVHGSVASVAVHCAQGCIAAWQGWTGTGSDYGNEYSFTLATGDTKTIKTNIGCRPGVERHVWFNIGTVNGPAFDHSWRVRCA